MADRKVARNGSCFVCVVRTKGNRDAVHELASGQDWLLTDLSAVHVLTERDPTNRYWLDTWRIPLTGKTRTVVGTDGVCRLFPLTVDDVSRRLISKQMPAASYGIGKVQRGAVGSGPEKTRPARSPSARIADAEEKRGNVSLLMLFLFGDGTGGREFHTADRKHAGDFPASWDAEQFKEWLHLCELWDGFPTLFHLIEGKWAEEMFNSGCSVWDQRREILLGWIESTLKPFREQVERAKEAQAKRK